MIDLSVIIPDRNGQPFLQQTVNDLLKKAETNVEIIVVADGIWPDPPLEYHPQVIIIHHGTPHNNRGMRDSISRGVAISKGKYIMKIDEHCLVDQGYDRKLIEDCEPNSVVIPRRYRLDHENFTILEDGRPPIDYMTLDYPYQREFDKTCGLHGAEDKDRAKARADILVDEVMTMQGSCYFMPRSYWDFLFPNGLNSDSYGQFTQEAQEISNSAWLSGGKVLVNKKTWYAHMHKGKRGKGYGFSNKQYEKHMEGTEKGRLFCIDYWFNNKHMLDSRMIHDFDWLINHFGPLKGWPENWREQAEIDKLKDYSLRNQQ